MDHKFTLALYLSPPVFAFYERRQLQSSVYFFLLHENTSDWWLWLMSSASWPQLVAYLSVGLSVSRPSFLFLLPPSHTSAVFAFLIYFPIAPLPKLIQLNLVIHILYAFYWTLSHSLSPSRFIDSRSPYQSTRNAFLTFQPYQYLHIRYRSPKCRPKNVLYMSKRQIYKNFAQWVAYRYFLCFTEFCKNTNKCI